MIILSGLPGHTWSSSSYLHFLYSIDEERGSGLSSWSDPRYHLNTIDLRDPGEVSEVSHGAVGRSIPDVTVADPTLSFCRFCTSA